MDLAALKTLFNIDEHLVRWSPEAPVSPNDAKFFLSDGPQRYADWKAWAESANLYPTEFLLPRILCHCPRVSGLHAAGKRHDRHQ